MVADEVHIDTLSYREGAKAVHWESDGQSEYTIDDGEKAEIGTTITLFLNDDSLEFCNEYRVREVLNKYCSFMPVPIYLEDVSAAVNSSSRMLTKGHRCGSWVWVGHMKVYHSFFPWLTFLYRTSGLPQCLQ